MVRLRISPQGFPSLPQNAAVCGRPFLPSITKKASAPLGERKLRVNEKNKGNLFLVVLKVGRATVVIPASVNAFMTSITRWWGTSPFHPQLHYRLGAYSAGLLFFGFQLLHERRQVVVVHVIVDHQAVVLTPEWYRP